MLQILDSTLREGEQSPGVYFSPSIKLAIAQLLDQIGVDIIEVGNPAVDPEIALAVTNIAKAGLKSKIGAHSLCRLKDVDKALDCGIDFLGIFYSVSQKRLQQDYDISLGTAIDRIVQVIAYAHSQQPDLIIRYTPEDTVRSPIENVIAAASAAVQAGASIISIADTTGYAKPFHPQRRISHYVTTIKEALAERHLYPKIEVHCHNDRGLALANGLDAYYAGADIIDVSVMGIGERAGIIDIGTILANLTEINPEQNHWRLEYLKDLYSLVSHYSHIPIPPHHPLVGKNAFTHYAGVHVSAIAKDESLYQSIDPKNLGFKSDIALGMQSGISAVLLALKQINREELIDDHDLVSKILKEIKEISKRGTPINIERELPSIVESCSSISRSINRSLNEMVGILY